MIQYNKDQQVTVTVGRPKREVTVTGIIFSVLPIGDGLQVLTVYGTTPDGQSRKVKAYNDNSTLKVISSSQKN